MSLKDKTTMVTGGSRGLGLGLVEALVDQGAKVTVVARDQAALAAVQQRLGVAVIPADVTDEGAAQRILTDVRPEVLVLNAGATPRMGRLDQLSWADFTAPWETDDSPTWWLIIRLYRSPRSPATKRFQPASNLFPGPAALRSLGAGLSLRRLGCRSIGTLGSKLGSGRDPATVSRDSKRPALDRCRRRLPVDLLRDLSRFSQSCS